jgi:hypothetical protein
MQAHTRYCNLTDSELERTCYGDLGNTEAADELRRRALDTGFLPDASIETLLENAENYDAEATDREDDVKRLEGEIIASDKEHAAEVKELEGDLKTANKRIDALEEFERKYLEAGLDLV